MPKNSIVTKFCILVIGGPVIMPHRIYRTLFAVFYGVQKIFTRIDLRNEVTVYDFHSPRLSLRAQKEHLLCLWQTGYTHRALNIGGTLSVVGPPTTNIGWTSAHSGPVTCMHFGFTGRQWPHRMVKLKLYYSHVTC